MNNRVRKIKIPRNQSRLWMFLPCVSILPGLILAVAVYSGFPAFKKPPFEIGSHFGWFTSGLSRFNQYMLLLNIIMLYSLLRVALLRITGYLFLNYNLFSEYIHNSFVVNKGTGIILFPVVITAHYFPVPLVSIVLLAGLFILVISVILKSIRAYQIIKRKDVVLFYLILYLCTLEFLPLLLGYKIIISLI